MSFNRYYQSELTALRELGKRFAERNPALAPFLGQSGSDPDVERLLEGFAFLTGRLRQKLDDELPELTHSLMHLLWPHYMRPLPAFAMLQFEPLQRAGAAACVARGTPVEARPLDGASCRFQTTSEIEVLPLALRNLDYSVRGAGARLVLDLAMTVDGHLGEVDLRRLRLHLSGERYISSQLQVALLRYLQQIQLQPLDDQGQALLLDGEPVAPLRLAPDRLQPEGFADDQALLDYPPNSLSGYRLLQEYFAFQEKFLFVQLTGLEALRQWPETLLQRARGLRLSFELEKSTLQGTRPTRDNLRLYCTPVANLFRHDALPIRLDGTQDAYLLRPGEYAAGHCEVFSVERVTGWRPGVRGYRNYVPFESFEHADSESAQPFYSLHQQASPVDGHLESWLRFPRGGTEVQETLSIELTCSNGNLAQRLRAGDICLPGEKTPGYLRFRNIGRVTPSYAPPLQHDVLWRLISNMSLNYLSLSDIASLRLVLQTYDLPRHHDRQAERVSKRLLGGLQQLSSQRADRLHRGLPMRGIRTELVMDADAYLGEGDLHLFASVINEFLALYASLNSFHQLHVRTLQGEHYPWKPRMGQQPLL